jgi:hypothetical protein
MAAFEEIIDAQHAGFVHCGGYFAAKYAPLGPFAPEP